VTENGIMLTDKGRYQIIQGIRHFDILHSGDPELQPIRSFECAAIVQRMYKLAKTINEKYSPKLEQIYNRQDFISRALISLSSGVEKVHYVDTPIVVPEHTPPVRHIKPVVSLRFIGSYYFLGYFCWIAILLRLFGFSWLSILVFMLIVFIGCGLYNVYSAPVKTRTE
jgi:sphingomyelin phosphodiesterase 4